MKRGGPLRRTPLKPGKPPSRSAPLARTTRLRVRPKRKMSEEERAAARAWHEAVVASAPVEDGRRVCPVCRKPRRLQAHHVVPKEAIRKHVEGLRLSADDEARLLARLLWTVQNGLPVCVRCHHRHTDAVERIPIVLLQRHHWVFAREIGLEHLLARTYAT